MKNIMMIASAAAMAMTMPALAQAQGKGKGASQRGDQTMSVKRNARSVGQARIDARGRTDARANLRARSRTGTAVDRRVDVNRNGIPDFREQRLADANGNGIADFREQRMVDVNRNGIADFREGFVDRNRDGVDDRAQNQFAGNICPPGLAKKTPACIPPGQAKRMFNQGQRLPANFSNLTDFDDLSPEFRDRLPGEFRSDNFDFIVRDNSVFVVDPTTRIVRSIIDLLRR